MAQSDSFEIDRTQRNIGPIWLSLGVAPINVLALFYSGMMTIIFVTTTGLLQPYLLHEHLRMPTDVQGDFTGNLGVITEIVVIAVVVAAGVSSDRVGRGGIFVGGFLLIAISFIFLPLARDPLTFIALRVITSAGIAMCLMMLASVIADYPQNTSRGKLISINGVITGIGVVLIASLIFAQLPEFFTSQGAEPIAAGTYTFWLIAGVALFAAFFTFIGIKESQATAEKNREPFVQLLRTGIGEVRKNPRLGLTCLAYFVSRGDLAVFVMFFSLWIMAVATDQGMTVANAQSTAGRLFGVSQLAMLLFTPVMGFIVDRFDRVTALAIAMAIAFVGYLAIGLVGNPLDSPFIYIVAIMAGAGEACVIVSGPALLGQEAPAKIRGSIVGLVGFFGAVGVLIHLKVSGLMFDAWDYQAPFLYMAALNGVVCVAAIALRVTLGSARGQQSVSVPAADPS